MIKIEVVKFENDPDEREHAKNLGLDPPETVMSMRKASIVSYEESMYKLQDGRKIKLLDIYTIEGLVRPIKMSIEQFDKIYEDAIDRVVK